MIAKALASGADEVVLDLEDAVAAAQKDAARRNAARVVAAPECSVAVRIKRGSERRGAETICRR
jgi:citrate lyase beta subunit